MFGSSPRERADALYGVLNTPPDTSAAEREAEPGFFEGSAADAFVQGLQSAGTRIGSLMTGVAQARQRQSALMVPAAQYDARIKEGLAAQEAAFEEQQKVLARTLVELRPDPKTQGLAAQIVFGATDVLGLIGATGGNPWAGGLTYGLSQAEAGMAEGLDPLTAYAKGGIEGVSTGLGVKLPASLTGPLVTRIASGAAINVGLGVPTRASVSAVLESRGYPEMAQQYAPLDLQMLATEAVLGAAFGGALGSRAQLPSTVDAALVARQAAHAEIDSAPGIPIDTASRQAHMAALDSATASLMAGEAVDVEPLLREAGFTPHSGLDFDPIKVIEEELRRAGAPDLIASLRGLEAEAGARGLEVESDALPAMRDAPAQETAFVINDPRLQDPAFRESVEWELRKLVSVREGNLALVVDPNFIRGQSDKGGEVPMIRSKSQNPAWFQSLAASERVSVDYVREATRKMLAGKKIGAKQQRVAQAVLDEMTAQDIDYYVQEAYQLGITDERFNALGGDRPEGPEYAERLRTEVEALRRGSGAGTNEALAAPGRGEGGNSQAEIDGDLARLDDNALAAEESELDAYFSGEKKGESQPDWLDEPESTMPDAAALIARSDEAVSQAQELAPGFKAAVDCALRFGE